MNRTSRIAAVIVAALVGMVLAVGDQRAADPGPDAYPFAFTDAGAAAGLFPSAANI